MGLFQKKEKKTWVEKEPIMVKCPNCGKEHLLAVFECKWLLDGMPAIPTTEWVKCMAECECGMLVTKADININVMELDGYQEARKETDKTLRLLKMLYYANSQDATIWLIIAKYFREQEAYGAERDALLFVLDALKKGYCHPWTDLWEGQFANLKIDHSMCVMREHCLIDVYRRIADWNAALQLIQQERQREYFADPGDIMRWLRKEEKLIKARDTSPQ